MKILFDITVLGVGTKVVSSQTGVFRVIEELLIRLKDIQQIELDYSHIQSLEVLEYSKKYIERNRLPGNLLTDRRSLAYTPFEKMNGVFKRLYQIAGVNHARPVFYKAVNDIDLFHSTFYAIPQELKEKKLKRVITVYDVIPILFPEMHPMKDELEHIVDSIGNDFSICISQNTKNDLCNYDKSIDPERVFVSLLAASPVKFYVNKSQAKFDEVRLRYSLPERYFLSLSTLEPRKNMDHVIRCFLRLLKQQNILDLYLVLVGSKGWQYEAIFNEFDGASFLKDKIIITGRIPDEDLSSVYSNAQAFFYMSLYEGFGLPPLEAMQCGVPTVTSNNSSLPEVVGEGGVMHDARDEDALCHTMLNLYSSEDLRHSYSKKALEQSNKFSWDKYALQHLKIYNQIIEMR